MNKTRIQNLNANIPQMSARNGNRLTTQTLTAQFKSSSDPKAVVLTTAFNTPKGATMPRRQTLYLAVVMV